MLTQSQALKKAADYCVRREQCVYDVRIKLKRWGLTENEAELITDKLKEERFIDENRYAEFYVKDKFRLNAWGRIKIRYMLRSKQIPAEIIERQLSEIPESEYRDTCCRLATQKASALKSDEDRKKRGKIMQFLNSRGFETEIIIGCIDEICGHD